MNFLLINFAVVD